MREAIGNSFRAGAISFARLVAGALLLAGVSSAHAEEDKIFYGADQRQDYYEITDEQVLEWGDSTCALVSIADLSQGANGKIVLETTPYEVGGFEACDDEPFATQPTAAFCTGFVVGQDLIATAGHCITDEIDLSQTAFVFGFRMEDANNAVTEFDADQVYLGVELVGRALGGALDHCVLRVDRPITAPGATVLPIRREGDIAVGDPVGTIGFSTGLPEKFSFGDDTVVKENPNGFYFSANLDAAGGNSGSPVFNTDNNLVEGILVRGPAAQFVLDPSGCFRAAEYPNDGALLYVDTSKTSAFAELIPESGLSERGYDFRAIPARSEDDAPVVSLSWIDPELAGYDKVILVRSVSDYPLSQTQGALVFNGRDDKFLDQNVIEGTRYFYTLFVTFSTGLTQVSFATVVAGDDAPTVLSEPFAASGSGGLGAPFDLQFSQITFTPVGEAVDKLNREIGYSGYEAYEATVVKNIRDFPVPREDRNGGSFNLPLSDEGTFSYGLGSLRFPYFGRDYSRFFIHANGFISFTGVGADDILGTPGVLQHFAIPRISGLFADLAPTNGGQVWVRELDDRLAITFENVPGTTGGTIFSPPPGNSFQIELFFSGTIRFTYKSIGVQTSFVGISDGRGVPQIPQELFPGVTSTLALVDFSALAAKPAQLHFQPVAPIVVDEGATIELNLKAIFDTSSETVPTLDAEWTRAGSPPFGDNGDGTGIFRWETGVEEVGVTTLRVKARLGDERAYQDIRIIVGEALTPPEARNLELSTGAPNEDTSESRIVSSDRPLFAVYDYFHPKLSTDPNTYSEGPSLIRWFRNGEVIPSLSDSLTVPASATRAGDVWHFRIVPLTATFIAGEEAISPFVTIVDFPLIEAVTPGIGLTTGGEKVRIFGTRLSAPLGVTFGGTPAVSVRAISDNELEVISPLHVAGIVSVSVRTVSGTGTYPSAFRYVNSLDDLDKEDLNVDGKVDAVDIQIVAGAVLADAKALAKATNSPDVNGDGQVNAADVQLVVNRALLR